MKGSPVPFEYRRGVHIAEAGLWLDPARKASTAFVSHAHADHARRHSRVIATPETLALMRARGLSSPDSTALPFGERLELDGCRIELFPAGHVLGSAQIRVETESGSLVYTGDFKLRPGLSCEHAESREADVLIMETTYGRPRYRFPPAGDTAAALVRFCHESLEAGATPVLLGYSLGKAQEILAALESSGLEAVAHESIVRINTVYREFGRSLPACDLLENALPEGKVVVFPPNADRSGWPSGTAIRTAAVTGWGLDPSARYRFRCDAVFPVSDHAGYDDLFRYVERVDPRVVYTLHGYAEEFARDLRARGREAWSLISNNQLEFPFAL